LPWMRPSGARMYRRSRPHSLAPHVAGAMALLLSAYPNPTVTEQETVLINSTVNRGPVGPDNDYGNGRLDVLAAYQSLSRFHVYLPIAAKAAP